MGSSDEEEDEDEKGDEDKKKTFSNSKTERFGEESSDEEDDEDRSVQQKVFRAHMPRDYEDEDDSSDEEDEDEHSDEKEVHKDEKKIVSDGKAERWVVNVLGAGKNPKLAKTSVPTIFYTIMSHGFGQEMNVEDTAFLAMVSG